MIELLIAFVAVVAACFLLANHPHYNGRRDADLERWLNQDGTPP